MNNKVIKSSLWYTISSFLLNSISIITTPIFARLLTLNDYGMYSNFIAIYSILSIIITLNLHSTLIRAKYDFKEDMKRYISTLIYVGLFATIFIFILVIVFLDDFMNLLDLDEFSILLLFLTLIFLPSINIFQIWQRINYKYKSSVLISFLLSISNVALSLFFVFFSKNKLHGRILGAQLPIIIIGFFLMVHYFKASKDFNIKQCKYALKICLPYLPHLLSLNLLNIFDKVMITQICGAQYNALYSLAVNCGLIMTILINALNSSFSPWLGEKLHFKEYKQIKKVSYLYILLFFLVAIGNLLIAPEVLLIFGGAKYMEALYVVPPIVVGGMCQLLYTIYVNIEQFEKRTIGMAIASCFAALINYLLNSLLLPQFGYIAAAYTTLISYLCLLAFHYCLVRKMGLSMVYNTKYIFVILLTLIVISFFMLNLYKWTLLRYIVCLFYLFFVLIVFEKINKQFKKDHL